MGVLADMMVAAVNPNAASAMMTPIGHALELTVIRWLAQLIGMPSDADGILLSGGNEANLVGLLVAREHRAPWPVRTAGLHHSEARKLHVYATAEVHAGVSKAVEIAGLGRDALHIVAHDSQLRMDVRALQQAVRRDREAGGVPICVIASLGTIATGAVDPLNDIVAAAAEDNLWVHVDGSYGAAAAMLPDASADMRAISKVDSVSWDPHKWLRVPYEAGCVLIREPHALRRTFGHRPAYYNAGSYENVDQYYEKGPQNSRNLRALKVWMSLMQHGREGHVELISRDLQLTRKFFEAVKRTPQLEARSCSLCVVTFRYVPDELRTRTAESTIRQVLNNLNRRILDRIQAGGDSYLSNALVEGEFLLRACFVNYRTRDEDLSHVIGLVCDVGQDAYRS
jgi:glutamate/tyrosine decarboxylase-like PLP-dependent enzyme